MSNLYRAGFYLLAAVLSLLLCLFVVFGVDTLSALLERSRAIESGALALLIYLESSKAVIIALAVLTAGWLIVRAGNTADGRAFTLFLLFGAFTFHKALSASSFPGPLQESTAIALSGLPVEVRKWLFGGLLWTVWPALAAAVRLSIVYTRPPLTAQRIDESGAFDRRGMMRGQGLAGLDVGAALRRISTSALRAGWFEPGPLVLFSVAMIAVMTLLPGTARLLLSCMVAGVLIAVAMTNLRAAYLAASDGERARMGWLVLGGVLGAGLAVLAAAPLLVLNAAWVQIPALVLLMLAPAALMVCLAIGVMYRGGQDPRHLVRRLNLAPRE